MKYKCKIIKRDAQSVLAVRTTSSAQNLPVALGKNYGAIMQYLGQLNEQTSGPPFVAYYNMDMQNLDIDIGIPVAKKIADKDEIKASEIPAGKYASCLYIGPYSGMAPTYELLAKFVEDKGYESTGIAYELYLDDPSVVPPEKLQTQILFPLK
ncbi:MAG: GyrI-like domain-containing protein [Candidatus Lokiarchaeota archaeon]|nr:GyrI-like domain-containing protein [Candidatus Lokiarchaeota archaeon]